MALQESVQPCVFGGVASFPPDVATRGVCEFMCVEEGGRYVPSDIMATLVLRPGFTTRHFCYVDAWRFRAHWPPFSVRSQKRRVWETITGTAKSSLDSSCGAFP